MRSVRIWLLLTGAVLTAATLFVATYYYFLLPHAIVRVTTGPAGTAAQRFISAFAAVTKIEHPRVRIELVEVPDLAAASQALENGTVDLTIVRTDAVLPTNGQTIAILRRDVVAFLVPAKSKIDKIARLAGKTIGIPKGLVQTYNEQALDTILSYYDIPKKDVKRVFLAPEEIARAIGDKQVAAMLAVGPIAPGEVVDVVNGFKSATHKAPELIAIDEAEAIAKRFPGFESIDVPAGAFSGRPPVPSDTVTTLAVTYRFAASTTMLDILAGAIARSIFTTKAKLMAKTPLASQIEAPDPDEKSPILPIHRGVSNYLNNGDQSFFDEFQQYFYLGGMFVTAVASVFAFVLSQLRQRKTTRDLKQVNQLIEIADQAASARAEELDSLEAAVDRIAAWFLKGESGGDLDSTALSFGLQRARHMIERRREMLRQPDVVRARSDPP